jgi:dethiobiotin synthase
MQGFFVTGTDTGVGKTVVSAALAMHTGYGYWKPIQTGPESDTAEVQRLAGCSVFDRGVRLPDPVSPHLAAERAGVKIDLGQILALAGGAGPWPAAASQAASAGCLSTIESGWIVEGAGGVLVPLNDREKMIDLMSMLALPVVVVARGTLGTINHTLLTLAALRSRGLHVDRVVVVGPPNADNCAAIHKFGNVPVAAMPWFDPLTPEALKGWTP